MNLFDQLVDQALQTEPLLAPLRVVVEKELLHHDILREMSQAGFLEQLTFIGGTCLRACYGSRRLSEDLDFTGGTRFQKEQLLDFGHILEERLETRYGLTVVVKEPVRETGNVDTWKLKIITRPEQKHLAAQRINIDICALPSHDRLPMMLRNHYGIEMGTLGLILQAQSREEILADKFVALALRPKRIKNRDLWDIVWLKQQGVDLPLKLVVQKVHDRQQTPTDFVEQLLQRKEMLLSTPACQTDFMNEMRRFLPSGVVAETVENPEFWPVLVNLVSHECDAIAACFF